MADHLIAQEFCILLGQSQTVVLLVAVPLFQLDNKIHRLGILNTLNTKQGLHINNTNTTKLNKVTCNIRCGTN